MRPSRSLFRAVLPLFLISPLAAQAATSQEAPASLRLPSPVLPVEPHGPGAWRLAEDETLVQTLTELESVRLEALPFLSTAHGLEFVDVELERIHVVSHNAKLFVDEELAGGFAEMTAGLSLWSGTVVGEQPSNVYLAFGPFGTSGWIERGGDRAELRFLEGVSGTVLLHEDDPLRPKSPSFSCGVDEAVAGSRLSNDLPPTEQAGVSASTSATTVRLALDVDGQYVQKLTAVMQPNYPGPVTFPQVASRIVSDLGPVVTAFKDGALTDLRLVSLRLRGQSLPPWSRGSQSQLSKPCGQRTMSAALAEFDQFYQGISNPDNYYNNAHLVHWMSGYLLAGCNGGGLAGVGDLCTQGRQVGTGLSCGLDGTNIAFQKYAIAHELGHNFGALHTHEFPNPPNNVIDTCGTVCKPAGVVPRPMAAKGTIMSYCHQCKDGMKNIAMVFHGQIKPVLQTATQRACVRDAARVERYNPASNQGFLYETSPAVLGTSWEACSGQTCLKRLTYYGGSRQTPQGETSILALSAIGGQDLPLNGAVGRLYVNLNALVYPLASSTTGTFQFPVPNTSAVIGIKLYAQSMITDPNLVLQNALIITLGL